MPAKLLLLACGLTATLAGCYRPLVANDEVRAGALQEMLARAERVRGIYATDPVDVEVVTAAELAGTARRAMLTPWHDDELARYEESLATVGLWPPDRRLLDEMSATLGAEAVGLYVPEDRKLYVVSDPAVPMSVRLASAIARRDLVREYALAHELVHFLQHEGHPALFDAVVRIKDSDDSAWAAQAAIEGDAVRYGFAALGPAAPAPADFQRRIEKAVAKGPLAREPRFIREGIVFPYGYGYRLSMLEASLLLVRPPASTEQALHLDKRYDPFTVFDLSAAPLPRGCTELWQNSVGELGFSILLRELDETPDPRAWEGWDGDRYIAARCAGQRSFVWLTSWDTVTDAEEFAAEFQRVADELARRSGLSGPPSVEVREREVVVFTRELAAYASTATSAVLRRRASTLEEALGPTAVTQADPTK